MAMRFMEPSAVLNLLRLSQEKVPPPLEIIALKAEIESRTRAAELRSSITGKIDMNEVNEIVQMKLGLDGLYGLWAEGKL